MVNWLSIFRHLLPRAEAWRLALESKIQKLFLGLTGIPTNLREFIDNVYLDLFPATTRGLAEWEHQFGLFVRGTEATRRQALTGAWQATGGQSPRYLQDVLQASGFDLYVHEWWSSGPDPWVARDPRDHTNQPLIGTVQCADTAAAMVAGDRLAVCGETTWGNPNGPPCDGFLVNETHYLVNENLTRRPPPPVPDDPAYWPFFVYIGAETFPDIATIPAERRFELEQLLLQLFPTEQWIVLLIDFESGVLADENDDFITDENDDFITASET